MITILVFADDISVTTVAENMEWKNLLHIGEDGKSEISDKDFFLSSTQNFSAKNELEKSLEILKSNKKCETICKFPARFSYISKQFDLNITLEHCTDLQKFLKSTRGESVSLIFASSFLGSPISYFGHTFLRVNKLNNPYFSQTLGYAAEVDSTMKVPELVSKGLSGRLIGKYIIAPYFKLYENYSTVEQRTLVEYKLNLTQEEIDKMILHAYEVFGTTTEYGFFRQNCAYQMLWLLEVARPILSLRNDYKFYAIPAETVQQIKDIGITTDVVTKLSLIDSAYLTYQTLSEDEKEFFGYLQNSSNKSAMLETSVFEKSTKNKFAYLLNANYDILFKKFKTSKEDYFEVKKIKYESLDKQNFGDTTRNSQSMKISLGRTFLDNQKLDTLEFRPILFDRFDTKDSAVGEGTLEFLKLGVQKQGTKNRLEYLNIVEVESLTSRFDFYKPYSWRLYAGANRNFKDENLTPALEFGLGEAYTVNEVFGYLLAQTGAYPTNSNIGLQALGGLSFWHEGIHFGVDFKRNLLFLNNNKPVDMTKIYVLSPITKATNIEIWADWNAKKYGVKLGLRF